MYALQDILKQSQRAGMDTVELEQAVNIMKVVPKKANDMMAISRLQGWDVRKNNLLKDFVKIASKINRIISEKNVVVVVFRPKISTLYFAWSLSWNSKKNKTIDYRKIDFSSLPERFFLSKPHQEKLTMPTINSFGKGQWREPTYDLYSLCFPFMYMEHTLWMICEILLQNFEKYSQLQFWHLNMYYSCGVYI